MRLDKFLSSSGICSRKEAIKLTLKGALTVNGKTVKRSDVAISPECDTVCLNGEPIRYEEFVYIMLNKPEGYISATEDGNLPVVTSLLSEALQRRGVFPCGRLDKDTVGLMILTDDGALSHALLSPKRHVAKIYGFTLSSPLPKGAEKRFAQGVPLKDGICKSARLCLSEDRLSGEIVLTEGKYHQIKRMMQTEGSEVVFLERRAFGGIPLDTALGRGEWRPLTQEEVTILKNAPAKNKDL
ncbi:MAG: rRNA pseudouridine synthase [Clostridia bacterium]|nr:rRNA pseudouridine synthase [Clostridia bacterium]